jgi:hypothetical protein
MHDVGKILYFYGNTDTIHIDRCMVLMSLRYALPQHVLNLLSDEQKFCNYFDPDDMFIVFVYSLTLVHGLSKTAAPNEIITFTFHSVQYFIVYSGKYMYHLLYYLTTRLVPTVCVCI